MKFSRKIVISGAIVITILVAVAIVVPVVLYNRNDITVYDDPVVILGDEDFAIYDFLGTGTEQYPYIIENLRINTTLETGILIKHTTKHFIIRDCFVAAQSVGIHIDDISSGTAIISNNTCADNDFAGILIERSELVIIENNLCYENKNRGTSSGIYLSYSDNATIKDNFCKDNWVGLDIENSHNGTIYNNTIFKNDLWGIGFYHSTNFTVQYNIISINIIGVIIYHASDFNVFSYNLVQYGILGGIRINPWMNPHETPPSFNVIHHNSFIDNTVVVGALQVEDNGYNNTWYCVNTNEGNYYSDYEGFGSYQIPGTAYTEDPYPLDSRPVLP